MKKLFMAFRFLLRLIFATFNLRVSGTGLLRLLSSSSSSSSPSFLGERSVLPSSVSRRDLGSYIAGSFFDVGSEKVLYAAASYLVAPGGSKLWERVKTLPISVLITESVLF